MIFILGGEGFVGSALARHCRRQGITHAVITRANYRHFQGHSCDVLINANGNARKYQAQETPIAEFDASTRSVRASLIDFKAARYVYLSSCDVYPDCSSPETTVENAEPEIARQSPYGFHKYLAELCVRHAAPRWLIVRLGGMVGPGLRKNPVFDILHGGPLRLDPDSELQFLGTHQVAAIVLHLIARDVEGAAVNLCGQGLIRLAEVMDLAGRQVAVEPGSPCVRYDVSIARVSEFAAVPETRRTVAQFVNAFREARNAARFATGAGQALRHVS